MTGEAFKLIVVHELGADAEEARLRWQEHEHGCWRRRFFLGRCADCRDLESAFNEAVRRLLNGGMNVILE